MPWRCIALACIARSNAAAMETKPSRTSPALWRLQAHVSHAQPLAWRQLVASLQSRLPRPASAHLAVPASSLGGSSMLSPKRSNAAPQSLLYLRRAYYSFNSYSSIAIRSSAHPLRCRLHNTCRLRRGEFTSANDAHLIQLYSPIHDGRRCGERAIAAGHSCV